MKFEEVKEVKVTLTKEEREALLTAKVLCDNLGDICRDKSDKYYDNDDVVSDDLYKLAEAFDGAFERLCHIFHLIDRDNK